MANRKTTTSTEVKRCWYGYASEETIAAAITGTTTEEEPASVVGDGYMRFRASACAAARESLTRRTPVC